MLNRFHLFKDLRKMSYSFIKKFVILTFLLTWYTSDVTSEKQPVVQTPLGEVAGYYMQSRGGRQIAAFTAIPYAVAPVGDLRFKAPVPIDAWQEQLDATKVTPVCVQKNPYIRQKDIVGQEDCLYLNIYTPVSSNDVIDDKNLLPVMVFLHGGGWMCGDASTQMYGPQFLLDRDVILVTTNYRLGPLGFLSTQDEHCPGNNGLKDQQEALRFIQKTIESFGGDKQSVTIFGESAGGASVHYHMISESSAGLFHKAISESGTALVPWAEAPPGEALRNAFSLAKFLDCPQAPSEKMINCLRNKDSYDIINTEFRFYAWDYEPMTPFKAVAEPNLPGAFLRRSPRKIPDVPAVPWMTGLTKNEGCLKSVWITAYKTRYEEFISAFETIAPVTFYYENSPYVDEITEKIRQKYLKQNDYEATQQGILDLLPLTLFLLVTTGKSNSHLSPVVTNGILKSQLFPVMTNWIALGKEIYTDSYFAFPAVEAVELVLNYTKNPVYLYELAYKATNSFSQIFGDPKGDYGVCHADDLMHLFPIDFLEKPISSEDLRMSETIITLWTNFATTGNPNKPVQVPLNWQPATSGRNMEYLEIGTQSKMKKDLASRSRYWSTLPLWHNMRSRFIDEL